MRYTREQECIQWVRPGISDESSLVYINQDELLGTENPVEKYEKYILDHKNALRVEYALHQSFILDAKLFIRTIAGVFKKARRVVQEETVKPAPGKENA
jgi:lipopolysaccharide/colanic/teichoic acid biosynthesis glycosyltransferase